MGNLGLAGSQHYVMYAWKGSSHCIGTVVADVDDSESDGADCDGDNSGG